MMFLQRASEVSRGNAIPLPAHVYEVRPRKDKRGVDLISDVLAFGGLVYGGQTHRKFLTSPITGMSNQEPAITTMKRITSVAMTLTALFGLAASGCEKKTSDDLKQKAEETKQTVESKAKEAKEAADKQIEKAKPKIKEFDEKAKAATQDAMEKLNEKLKEATNTSPQPVSPTPAP
jgi:polyhydroxyalkanoate synthesis regulator phasin